MAGTCWGNHSWLWLSVHAQHMCRSKDPPNAHCADPGHIGFMAHCETRCQKEAQHEVPAKPLHRPVSLISLKAVTLPNTGRPSLYFIKDDSQKGKC